MAKKAIRFSALVRTSGKPVLVSLWTNPEQDRPFMKAVKENRVLTVKQEPSSKKKDFGRIGFHREPYSSYLIFPQALPEDKDSRVIGVKYDLIDQPEIKDPVSSRDRKSRPKRSRELKPPRQPEAKPTQRQFHVLVRRVAVIETTVSVPARTETHAKENALRQIRGERFDLARAILRDEVISIH